MSDNHDEKTYPEFDGLSGEEIRTRLSMLETLLKSDFDTRAGAETHEAIERGEPMPSTRDDMDDEENVREIPADFAVIAHRGWSGSYPENTLIGLREAIKIGCHSIEFDVAMTRDRRLIIIHDDTLSRTTNAAGFVNEWEYRDLRKLDAGAWFHPKYAGAHLPSLDEVLLISRGSGIGVNIEIKNQCWEEEFLDDGVEHQVVEAIHRYGVADRVLISSFRWAFIDRINQIDPGVSTALLHFKDVGKLNVAGLRRDYGLNAFNPSTMQLTQDFVNRCHDEGVKVYPFTVNSYVDMEKFLDMGVDGFFTNHPNRAFRFLEQHSRRLQELQRQEKREDVEDVDDAIKRLEREEMEKARKRARWRAKRHILETQKAKEQADARS